MRVKSLSSAGCRRIFEEVSPGGRWDRPELNRLLADVRMGDTVVVLTLDQLSRSFKEVLAIMVRITAAGAGFRSIVEGIDTTTPAGPPELLYSAPNATYAEGTVRWHAPVVCHDYLRSVTGDGEPVAVTRKFYRR
jgi:DNA invertase Pin-like site-specific DNA recombinase